MTKPINLLIADDDRFIRRSIIRMLGRDELFTFYEADSRDSVLNTLAESKIDCILMDYYMTDITGLELMRLIREKGISVPVIMLTGKGDEQLAANIMKAGAFDYIPKSRLAEQDFAMTLTTMVSNTVSRQEQIEEADRAKVALELSEARYRGLIENSPILIVRFFPEEFMISFVNDYFCSYFGVQRFNVLGENIFHTIPKSNHELMESRIRGITPANPVARIELKTRSNGEQKWQLWTVQGIFNSEGETSEYQCMGEDITDMKNTEKQLIEQRRYLQSILDSQDNMFIVADRTKVLEVNISFLQFFGFYSPDDMSKNFSRVAEMTVEMDGYLKPEDAATFWLSNISAETGAGQYRLIAFRQEGSETNRYFSVKFSPLSIDTDIYVVEFSDVTALEERSKEFENRANYDPLTRLYNRRRFLELLERGIKNALHRNIDLSVIFFDIDHFKKINDTYGHNTGDEVLKGLSSLVSATIRHSDIFARWGGEEFLLLLESTSLENAARAAEKIRKAIMEHEFPDVKQVTCSFGVTSFHPADTGESFINRADTALYRAKESGRNRVIGMRKKISEEEEKIHA